MVKAHADRRARCQDFNLTVSGQPQAAIIGHEPVAFRVGGGCQPHRLILTSTDRQQHVAGRCPPRISHDLRAQLTLWNSRGSDVSKSISILSSRSLGASFRLTNSTFLIRSSLDARDRRRASGNHLENRGDDLVGHSDRRRRQGLAGVDRMLDPARLK